MRLHDCLTRAARIWPAGPATHDGDRTRTWREICDEVARLAGGLRSLGASPGDRVALLGANSDRYLGSLFAASWAGALVVPLNMRLAEHELAACLRDSGASLLLAGDGFDALAERLGAAAPELRHVVHLGAEPAPGGTVTCQALVSGHRSCPPADGDGRTPTGVFYTAGTTGTPKGVVLTHDNLLANAWHILPGLGWGHDTVFLHAAPVFHLADLCCLIAVSAVAGRHVIIPGCGVAGRDMSWLTSILYGGSPMPGCGLSLPVRLPEPGAGQEPCGCA